jgi:RNA polymerase sigma factor (sigma-70 family)
MGQYHLLSDEDLWALVQASSDHSAYAELYQRYYIKLRRLLIHALKDADAANDIIQEIFLHLWVKREDINIQYKISQFLYRAALNQMLKAKRKEKVVQTYIAEFQKLFQEGHHSTDHSVAVKEINETVNRAMEHMRPKTKEIFKSSRFESMESRQISEQYGIPRNTVKHLIKEALRVMRDFGLKANSLF